MKNLKVILSSALIASMLFCGSAVSFADVNKTEEVLIKTEYTMYGSAYTWIWQVYPNAWKIDFVQSGSESYCKVYEGPRGDMNYIVVGCDKLVDGKCFVKN